MTTLPDNVTQFRPRPEPPAQGPSPEIDPVLFWAERDPAALWRSLVFMLLLLAPMAFFAPAAFIAGAAGALAAMALNRRSFQFHLTARELRLRPAALGPTLRLPLEQIAEATALPDLGKVLAPLAPRSGHLHIRKTDGTELLVPALKDVADVVDAIRQLKQSAEPEAASAA